MSSSQQELAIVIAGQVSRSLGSSIDQVNGKLSGMAKIAKGAAKMLGGAFAVSKVVDFGKDAVNTYSEFEQAMAQTAATAGANAEDYKLMEDAALEAGKKTTKTAKEAADALGYMSLAGWNTQQSVQGLMPILRASEAYQADLAETSDLVTDSLSALGLGVDDLGHYLDVATMANNKSNQTASQMMEAFISAGLTLDDLGDSIENVSGLYGMLANRGTKASEAGTAMKAITVNVKKNAKAIEKLGVSVYDTEGNFRGISAVLQDYNNATKNMSQSQRDAINLEIAGKNHLGSFNKIMEGFNTTLENGSSEWDTLVNNLNNADGALDKMADQTTDTMKGAMSRLNSAIDDVKIRLVKGIAPYATKAINLVSNAIPKLENVVGNTVKNIKTIAKPLIEQGMKELNKYRPFVQQLMRDILPIVQNAMSIFQTSILPIAKKVFNSIASIIKQLLPVVLPFISKVISAISRIIIVCQKIGIELYQKIMPIVSNVLGFITSTLVPKLIEAFQAIAPKVIEIINKVGPLIQAMFQHIKPQIETMLSVIQFVMPLIQSIICTAVDTIRNIINGLLQVLGGIIDFITGVFSGNWKLAWQGVVDVFGGIFNTIIGIAKGPLNAVIDLINFLIGKINSIHIDLPDWIPGLGGKSFGISIPTIPHLATGGIATKSIIAEIGEGSEPEAVLPLSKLSSMLNQPSSNINNVQPNVNINITIQGNATKETVQEIASVTKNEFRKMFNEFMREQKRVKLGGIH